MLVRDCGVLLALLALEVSRRSCGRMERMPPEGRLSVLGRWWMMVGLVLAISKLCWK